VNKISCALPRNVDVLIRKGSWDRLPGFQIVVEKGNVTDGELYQVFYLDIGMVAVVAAARAGVLLKFIRGQMHLPGLAAKWKRPGGEARVA
jgi:phosphoribosylformylglycinamidine cyclo-ligase